jgi:formylglycine-generating enzyme required for sulfatase activity
MSRSARWTLFAGALAYLGACVVQTDTVSGPKGDDGKPGSPGIKGDPGIPGEAGMPDSSALDALQAKLDALQSKVDALEKQAADPDCPAGYIKAAKPFVPANPTSVLCKKTDDEVVKVGTGGAAFWIDRYEASVWEGSTQRFANGDDSNLGSTFGKNGQSSMPWVARSVSSVTPSRYTTWFQAQAACRAGGKRLPNGEEWLAAARGTSDPPGNNDGSQNKKCNTQSSSMAGVRSTGNAGDPANMTQGNGCFSDWGADDMVGNLWEWTAEWYASAHLLGLMYNGMPITEPDTEAQTPWLDSSYNGDRTWGILSAPYDGSDNRRGLPTATLRGGSWELGSASGIFALDLNDAPPDFGKSFGFRCALPR